MTRRYVRNIDEEREEARRLRETFMDRPSQRMLELNWEWPQTMYEVGECTGVMYSSDKWEPPPYEVKFHDYKHISEGPQLVCVKPGFLREEGTGKALKIPRLKRDVGQDMPSFIATLAPIIGIQIRLYERIGGKWQLPKEGNLYHVGIERAKLGAARHPSTGQTFLCIFSDYDMPCIITGKWLDVTQDGVVG